MWNRKLLKERAKDILRIRYWTVFLGCLIAGLLGGGSSSLFSFFPSSWNSSSSFGNKSPELAVILLVIILFAVVFSFAFTIFVGNVITVGLRRYVMESRQAKPTLNVLFWGFQNGRYLKIVKTMCFYTLSIFLWTLLFIVPGIIKSYQYYYVPYLIADNPDIGSKRIFELSKQMTNGEKGKIFVLNLSFIGWYILGILTCCIGLLFLTPYTMATDAELYAFVRTRSIKINITESGELKGFAPN